MRRHCDAADLALYAGGDLGLAARLVTGLHVRTCSRCRAEVESFRDARRALREESRPMPPGLDWDRLAAEMKANIRLGVEAGECVGAVVEAPGRRVPLAPVAALALVLSLFLTLAWWQARSLRPVHRANARPEVADGQVVLKATTGAVGVERNGEALTLVHAGGGAGSVSVGVQGSLNARYIDEDGGQVTIHHVYTE